MWMWILWVIFRNSIITECQCVTCWRIQSYSRWIYCNWFYPHMTTYFRPLFAIRPPRTPGHCRMIGRIVRILYNLTYFHGRCSRNNFPFFIDLAKGTKTSLPFSVLRLSRDNIFCWQFAIWSNEVVNDGEPDVVLTNIQVGTLTILSFWNARITCESMWV